MRLADFTIGCDPEVFVTRNGKPVSAFGLVKGDKKTPQKVDRGAVQVDGMALEFNTDPLRIGVAGGEEFSRQVLAVKDTLTRMVKDVDPTLSLSDISTADFDKEYLDSQPDEAKELGCDPDYNAYTKTLNNAPDGSVLFRSAGGHVHVGWGADIPVDNPDHIEICANLVKVLDVFLGIPSLLLDGDVRRRQLYGQAGAMRPKPYGVEYRTLSNFWIKNATLRAGIHTGVQTAISLLLQNNGDAEKIVRGCVPGGSETVRDIINTNNHKKAYELFRYTFRHYFNAAFRRELTSTYGKIEAQQ